MSRPCRPCTLETAADRKAVEFVASASPLPRRRTAGEKSLPATLRHGAQRALWTCCVVLSAVSVSAGMSTHVRSLSISMQATGVAHVSPVRLSLRGGSSSPEAIWAATVDVGSGKTYYYNVKTKEVAWALPLGAMLRPPKIAATVSAVATDTATAGGAVDAQPAGAGQAYAAQLQQAQPTAESHATLQFADPGVTVHAPPVCAEVPDGFGRKVAEPAAATPDAATAAAPAYLAAATTVAAIQSEGVEQQLATSTEQGAVNGDTASEKTRPILSPNSMWREVSDPTSGKFYYYHSITKESVWTLPSLVDEGESSFTKFFTRLKTTAGIVSVCECASVCV